MPSSYLPSVLPMCFAPPSYLYGMDSLTGGRDRGNDRRGRGGKTAGSRGSGGARAEIPRNDAVRTGEFGGRGRGNDRRGRGGKTAGSRGRGGARAEIPRNDAVRTGEFGGLGRGGVTGRQGLGRRNGSTLPPPAGVLPPPAGTPAGFDKSGFGKDGKRWKGQETVFKHQHWKERQTRHVEGDSDQIHDAPRTAAKAPMRPLKQENQSHQPSAKVTEWLRQHYYDDDPKLSGHVLEWTHDLAQRLGDLAQRLENADEQGSFTTRREVCMQISKSFEHMFASMLADVRNLIINSWTKRMETGSVEDIRETLRQKTFRDVIDEAAAV